MSALRSIFNVIISCVEPDVQGAPAAPSEPPGEAEYDGDEAAEPRTQTKEKRSKPRAVAD